VHQVTLADLPGSRGENKEAEVAQECQIVVIPLHVKRDRSWVMLSQVLPQRPRSTGAGLSASEGAFRFTSKRFEEGCFIGDLSNQFLITNGEDKKAPRS
jgi:hypothetical protein